MQGCANVCVNFYEFLEIHRKYLLGVSTPLTNMQLCNFKCLLISFNSPNKTILTNRQIHPQLRVSLSMSEKFIVIAYVVTVITVTLRYEPTTLHWTLFNRNNIKYLFRPATVKIYQVCRHFSLICIFTDLKFYCPPSISQLNTISHNSSMHSKQHIQISKCGKFI